MNIIHLFIFRLKKSNDKPSLFSLTHIGNFRKDKDGIRTLHELLHSHFMLDMQITVIVKWKVVYSYTP